MSGSCHFVWNNTRFMQHMSLHPGHAYTVAGLSDDLHPVNMVDNVKQ